MEKETGKVYAVLGDSVSTFAGCTPEDGVFYRGWVQEVTGVKEPKDTWWMQVIHGRNGVVGVNNSYAGSTVSGNLATSATAENRLRALGKKGDPDVILLAMGANDWGFCVLPQEFGLEYRRMLCRLKCLYPQAEIWCATLLRGKDGETGFFNAESTISQEVYSEIIREAARETEVHLADVARYGIEYETVDGVHPTKEGMQTIAGLWLKEMKEEKKEKKGGCILP